jgi:hypothetical protein
MLEKATPQLAKGGSELKSKTHREPKCQTLASLFWALDTPVIMKPNKRNGKRENGFTNKGTNVALEGS